MFLPVCAQAGEGRVSRRETAVSAGGGYFHTGIALSVGVGDC